jgi:hypothetical protein
VAEQIEVRARNSHLTIPKSESSDRAGAPNRVELIYKIFARQAAQNRPGREGGEVRQRPQSSS